jgi:PST family polysaccharide transporter
MKKDFITNIVWLFVDNGLRICASIIVGAMVARYLGPEKYGILNYSLAMVGIFVALTTFGLNDLIMRDFTKSPEKADLLIGTTFIMKLSGCFLLLGVAFMLSFLKEDYTERMILIVIGTSFIFSPADNIILWFNSQLRSRSHVIAKSNALLIVSVYRLALIYFKADLLFFAISFAVERFVQSAALIFGYCRSGGDPRAWRFNGVEALRLFREAWPLFLSGFLVMLYARTDQLIVGYLLGNTAVGIYSAGLRIIETLYFIPTCFMHTFFSSIVQSKSVNQAFYEASLAKVFSISAMSSYMIILPLTLFPRFFITLLYGEQFIESSRILAILSWSYLFVSMGVIRSIWISIEGLTKYFLYSTGIAAFINIPMSYFLVKTYGIEGAAWALVLSQFIASMGSSVLFEKTRKIWTLQIWSMALCWRHAAAVLLTKPRFNQ